MNWKAGVLRGGVAAAAAGALLSGCAPADYDSAGSADPGTAQERVASLPQPGAAGKAGADAPMLGTPDASPKTKRPEAPAELAVAGVRVGSHQRFDRVVIDLEGSGTPGWYVNYVATPMQETVGNPLRVRGSAFLNINIDGTVHPFGAGVDSAPVDTSGGSGNIVDVVNAGIYEGRSQVVIGLRSVKPYSVQVLDNPTRLVVDIVKS
ncbi:AMIN-like domain-containing (lipo)protein [Corynebacterium sp. UBA2622]|uniref:AMIN-like domain-containing (lipo)protein n=1 Tax=Corynebacterium sp. UBA2622 TaxID=1946393 RepID=UPI0025BDA5E9|nr:hypothetical protein [Corynebacterium sp. UBA2622]